MSIAEAVRLRKAEQDIEELKRLMGSVHEVEELKRRMLSLEQKLASHNAAVPDMTLRPPSRAASTALGQTGLGRPPTLCKKRAMA